MPSTTTDLPVQRKLVEILRIIKESEDAIGARLIADRLNERGYRIGERGVRYHLRILDERGMTKKQGYEGRVLTHAGFMELERALVKDRLGFVITKIERMIYSTSFDLNTRKGNVVVNISIVDLDDFDRVMDCIEEVNSSVYTISSRINLIEESHADVRIPKGTIGIATMCSITIDGILLKNGIPVNIKYGGLVEIRGGKPHAFTDVIAYRATSIDPMKIFMSRKMTTVTQTIREGRGKVLANIREIPYSAKSNMEEVLTAAELVGIGGLIKSDDKEIFLHQRKSGRIKIPVYAGINTSAAVDEAGIPITTYPVSQLMKFEDMKQI
ncbi:MAG: HTH-type transcriptional regulator, global nitrogen regulator NrpRI [Candidatus Argoarchaeum ethanivorans]|uniref:HTH-type transcriptional regulator, global nitrogen regulator NrpRI n=1 Tax=Candidatus Argoarchaeum ethanivorans TaxID=2608793 RepID=A0A8B3S314_9EURY|nr:MAG: HTH-type transcriptional regulator, global nitrogen regulator NrpRI [Candidatus Argoarchaeum ethanivorans]